MTLYIMYNVAVVLPSVPFLERHITQQWNIMKKFSLQILVPSIFLGNIYEFLAQIPNITTSGINGLIQFHSVFSYKPTFMNGEFGSLWKGLWLILRTPPQFSGGAVGTCSCMIAGIPIQIQSQTQLTTLREWRAHAYMVIVQRRVWIAQHMTTLHYYVLPV